MRPAFEVAVRGRIDAEVVVKFLEDVDERRGRLDSHGHREAQPVRLARIVVGVLPDDDRLDLVDGAVVERRENLGTGRVHDVMLRLLLQELFFNLFKIRLFELVGEQVQPGLFKFYHVVMPAKAGISLLELRFSRRGSGCRIVWRNSCPWA